MTFRSVLVAGALILAAGQVAAQSSGRPIRIIVPYQPGGGSDVVARTLQVEMSKRLGQQLIVENRPGAGGVLGGKYVASADPDGTTYFFGYTSVISGVFFKTNFLDAGKELAPVANVGNAPLIIFVNSKLPVQTFQDLVAYAKANPPGKLNYAVQAGNTELVMHMIRSVAGITFTPIQYKGSAPAAVAVLSGEADVLVNVWTGLGDHVQSGRARAVAFLAEKRSDVHPQVPLGREVGLPNLESSAANAGFWVTRGSPQDLVLRISRAAVASVQAPEVAALMRKAGFAVNALGPEEQLKAYEAEFKFYTEAARIANYVPQ